MLSKEELIRYKRQIGIKSWDKPIQQKLKESTIFITGAGGLGGALIYYLAAAGIGNLKICDFDVVELSNLNRQILHNNKNIGIKKVDSAYKTISELNPDISIERIYDKIDDDNSLKLISDSDLIIDCLDNYSGRQIINKVSVKKSIPLIHAGVLEFQGQLSFLHPPETACLACFLPPKDSEDIKYIAGATAGVLGSLQAIEAIKYLTGIGENLKNKLLFWDGLSMKFETIGLSKNPDCKICS